MAPSSRATIGGMIANISCGAHSIYYGRTVDYIEELTVVIADGSLHTWHHHPYRDLPEKNGRTPQIPFVRRDSNELTVGQFYNPPKRETEAPAEQNAREANDRRRDSNTPGPPQREGEAPAEPSRADTIPSEIASAIHGIRTSFHDEIIDRYPRVLRRNGGYALDRLCLSDAPNPATIICGSEGTLALVVEAKLRLVPKPRHAALLVVQFDSVFDAVGATPAVLEHDPAAVELLDDLLLCAGAPEIEPTIRAQFLTDIPKAILVCEAYADDEATLREKIESLDASLSKQNIGVVRHRVFDRAVQAAVWEMRKRGFGLIMCKPGDRQPHEFIEDAAVDPRDLRAYLEQLTDAVNEEGCAELGYYAHASVGVIHVRPVLNLKEDADVQKLARIAERARELVAKFGGAFTGEHGDGLVRSWALEKMYGPRIIEAFRLLKNAFDPHDLLNPGKIIDPPPITQNLRYRNKPKPNDRELYFDYGEHKDIAGLAGMCTGVGQCRQKLVGTMCPSYMATMEEQHTTRARAVALRAALHGEGLLDGLDDPALHDVMDLCLSCKACKTECPTGVDMARLKAEWLAQTYKKSGVPAAAKFIANVPQNLRLAAISPSISNFFQDNAFTRALLEMRYGLDRRVPLPPIAKQTFRQWFATHDKREGPKIGGAESGKIESGEIESDEIESGKIESGGNESGGIGSGGIKSGGPALSRSKRDAQESKQVVYFADTWTNYFWPQVGIAAVRLLEAIGCEVIIPRVECCGRPMISKGLLDDARQLAQKNAAILAEYAQRGIPILGSEPSCILTFIDEFPHFVRTDEAKAISAATQTVEQFLYEHRAALAGMLCDHPNPVRQTEHRHKPNPLRQARGQD
ncbi:MAG: FAD-binding and (Fe-S)-binding domain-containing protein, partial [Phycisphaerae bacterium]